MAGLLIIFMILPGSSAQLKWPREYIVLTVWILLGYVGYRLRRTKKDITEEERADNILGEYK